MFRTCLAAGIVALLVGGNPTHAPTFATATAGERQPAALESAATSASQLPRLRSLLVSHNGAIVLERYFNGARAAQAANIKSASKSVISALVGIAVARGHIKSVDQKIGDYFPELAADPERR